MALAQAPVIQISGANFRPLPLAVPAPLSVDEGGKRLVEYLFRSQQFPHGAVLLTGAGVIPPDAFTLAADDRVRITISGVGTLDNPVAVV